MNSPREAATGKSMQTRMNTRMSNWRLQLASSAKLLLRWSWFVALTVVVSTASSYLLHDTPSVDSYTATLQLQVRLPAALANTGDINSTATFFSQLFVSPDILSLTLPRHKDLLLSDLQALVTATSVTGTNEVELSAGGTNSKGASVLVTDVYQAFLQKEHDQRSALFNGLTEEFTNKLKQGQKDVATTSSELQNLAAIHQESSFEYRQLNSLYLSQQSRVKTLNTLLLTINQQASGQNDILSLGSSTPTITTVAATAPTQPQRLALSPIIGLIMGLGGVMLATRFSNALPLRGAKRETVLPHISAVVPRLPTMKRDPLAALPFASSQCLHLLRNLRFQMAESGRQLKLITVTSAGDREGKSTLAACLAIAAAQNEQRVHLIDANTRRPILHVWFKTPAAPGTVEAVRPPAVDENTANLFFRSTSIVNLNLQPIGQVNQKLSHDRLDDQLPLDDLGSYIEAIRQQAELVIVDCPSLLTDASAARFATFSDVVLLVVDAQKSRSTTVLEAEAFLSAMHAHYATVLNRAAPEQVE